MNIKELRQKWLKVKEDFGCTTAALAPYPVTTVATVTVKKKNDKKKLQEPNN